MAFNQNTTPLYPGQIPSITDVMDKVGSTLFEQAVVPITIANNKAKQITVPLTAPYAIRLPYVPQQSKDVSGNSTGVSLSGLTEMNWDENVTVPAGKFMTNYINGEQRFGSDKAGAAVTPEYNATMTWAWAEVFNQIKRELIKTMETLGVNPHQGYSSVAARIAANELELQTARGAFANVNSRLTDLSNRITGVTSASFINQLPTNATGLLGSSAISVQADLSLKESTINTNTVKLKNVTTNAFVTSGVGVGYDDSVEPQITITHNVLSDAVYSVIISGVRDALNRTVPDFSWNFGVGSAIANDKPNVTALQFVALSQSGFTAKGNVGDTENDTIARLDIVYSPTNNVLDANAITLQYTGSDITLFKGAGKNVGVNIAAGQWYGFARAVETMSGGGSQVGDWTPSTQFIIPADQSPTKPNYNDIGVTGIAANDGYTIALSNLSQVSSIVYYPSGSTAIDVDDTSGAVTFEWAEGTTSTVLATGITVAQLIAGFKITSSKAPGTALSGFLRVKVIGDTTQYSDWSDAKTFMIPTMAVPSAPINVQMVGADGKLTISHDANASGESVTSYNLNHVNSPTGDAYTPAQIKSLGTKVSGIANPYDLTTPFGTKRYVVVTAVNAGGESLPSVIVSGRSNFQDAFTGTNGDVLNASNWSPALFSESGTQDTVNTKATIDTNQAKLHAVMTAVGLGGINAIASPTLDFTGGKKYRITVKTKTDLTIDNGGRCFGFTQSDKTSYRPSNVLATNAISAIIYDHTGSPADTNIRGIVNGATAINQSQVGALTDSNMHTFILEVSNSSIVFKIDGVEKYNNATAGLNLTNARAVLYAYATGTTAADRFFDDFLLEQLV